MKKTQRALFISVLVIFLMACNCNLINQVKEMTGLGEGSADDSGGSIFGPFFQTTDQPSDKPVTVYEEIDYKTFVPTEVIVPDGVLRITKYITTYDATTVMCRTFLLLENIGTDPLDAINSFSFTMTWYDDQNQVVDQWNNTNGPIVFAQEKNLWEPWVSRNLLTGRNVVRAVFEVKDIITLNSFFTEGQVRERVASTPLNHPFFSLSAEALRLEYHPIYNVIPQTTVSVQSALANPVGVQVVAFYFNEKGEVIGMGKSGPADLDAGASASLDVLGYGLTEAAARAEYYPYLVGSTDLLEMVYPDIYN